MSCGSWTQARPASKAALAAGKQGKYWEMHKKLFENNRALGPDDLKKYAQELGLDVAKWEADMNSKEIQDQINQQMSALWSFIVVLLLFGEVLAGSAIHSVASVS